MAKSMGEFEAMLLKIKHTLSQISNQLGQPSIESNATSFIEFSVFTGVAGELRPWISELEEFFVRERFTADEKMNLAQSLLEGEANAWFYSSRKRFAFQSWEHLMDLLIWRFGDLSDPALFLLWDKNDRLLQAKRRKRMATASLNLQESISSIATINETITVVEETSAIVAGNLAERAPEKKLVSQYQVPVSSLEPSFSCSSEPLDVSASWPCAIVGNNPVHSQFGFASVKNMNNAHHMFDELSHRRHKFPQRKKPSLSPKSRMFKFKNRILLSNWSQKDLHQLVDMSKVNNQSSCFSANFGLVRPKRPFQCLRLKKQAHLSRVPYQLRMLHDPGGMKQLPHGDIALHRVMSKTLEEFCVDHENSIMRLKLLLHSGFAGDKLTELDFHLRENHRQEKKTGLLVFPWNLLPLEFFWFIHLEDKVCLSGASNSWWGWLVFDRGKSNIISGDVITLVSKEWWMEILDGDIAKLLNSTCGKLQSYDYGLEITFLRRLRVHQQQQKRKFIKSWRFKYKSRFPEISLTDIQFLCEKVQRVSCLSLAAQFNSLEIIQAVLEQIIHGETSTKIIDNAASSSGSHAKSLLIEMGFCPTLVQKAIGENGDDLELLLEILTKSTVTEEPSFHGLMEPKSGPDIESETASRRMTLLTMQFPENLVDLALDRLGKDTPNWERMSIWHRWRRKDCTRPSSCVLPLQFSFFKLEDKLVLRGESIDTIGDVASWLIQVKASGCFRSFAVVCH